MKGGVAAFSSTGLNRQCYNTIRASPEDNEKKQADRRNDILLYLRDLGVGEGLKKVLTWHFINNNINKLR